MARNIDETGIVTGNLVLANHVLQLTDALRGDDAFNLFPTGAIQINEHLFPTGSATAGQAIIADGSTQLIYGTPNAITASYVSSSNVDGPFGFNSVISASYALTASHIDEIFTVTESFSNQISVNINHNFNTENVLIQAYEVLPGLRPVQVIPTQVTITDFDNVNVRFTSNTSGYLVATRGGFTIASNTVTALSSSYAATASYIAGVSKQRFDEVLDGTNSSYVLDHNLGEKYVILSAYNEFDEQVIPTKVRPISTTQIQVQFTTPFSGSVVVLA